MAVIIALSGLLGLAFNWIMPQGIGFLPAEVSRPAWQEVSVEAALAMKKTGAAVVDASDAGAYKTAHVSGAVNLYPTDFKLLFPLLRPQLAAAPAVLVYGKSFSRFPAATIAQRLLRAGLPKVLVLPLGVEELERAGWPVRKRRRAK